MLFQTGSSQAGGETAQTPTDAAESFYLLWLHQLNDFSPLSLLHLSIAHSNQLIVLYYWSFIQRLVIENNQFQLLEPGPDFFVCYLFLTLSFMIHKNLFHILPSSFCICCHSLEPLCCFFPPPSFLLSISTIFISASLCLSAISQHSTHTKGSVCLYCMPPLAQPPNQHTQLFL